MCVGGRGVRRVWWDIHQIPRNYTVFFVVYHSNILCKSIVRLVQLNRLTFCSCLNIHKTTQIMAGKLWHIWSGSALHVTNFQCSVRRITMPIRVDTMFLKATLKCSPWKTDQSYQSKVESTKIKPSVAQAISDFPYIFSEMTYLFPLLWLKKFRPPVNAYDFWEWMKLL